MAAKTGAARARKSSSIFKEAKCFSSFSVNDLERAKDFYGKTLGLKVSEMEQGLELNLAGGTKDIEEAVEELTTLGVKLEKYNQPDLKTDERGFMSGPGMQIAWFKDPGGNILSVIENER